MKILPGLVAVIAAFGGVGCYYETCPVDARAAIEPGYVTVSTAPPPLRVAVETQGTKPHPQAVWVAGHWHWAGTWVWADGHWEMPRPGYVWTPPSVVVVGRAHRYHPGYWRPHSQQPPPVYTRPTVQVSVPPRTVEVRPPQGGGTVVVRPPQGGGGTVVVRPPQGGGGTVVVRPPQGGGTVVVQPPQGGGTVVVRPPQGGVVVRPPQGGGVVVRPPTDNPGGGVVVRPGGNPQGQPGGGVVVRPPQGGVVVRPGGNPQGQPGGGVVVRPPQGGVVVRPGGNPQGQPGGGVVVRPPQGGVVVRPGGNPQGRPGGGVVIRPGGNPQGQPGGGTVTPRPPTDNPGGGGVVIRPGGNPQGQPGGGVRTLSCRLAQPVAPRGGVFTITGSGLGQGPAVRVGGIFAPVVRASDSQITAQMPTTGMGGAVSVTVGGQTSSCGSIRVIGGGGG